MFRTIGLDFIKFGKNNPLYLLCSLMYCIAGVFLLGANLGAVVSILMFYAISLLAVFTPLGEKILRILEHVRKIETKREKEYLLPLFEEVYMQAKEQNSKLGKIELCVIDKMTVNACALGKRTIAVTKGAMETFSGEELKAIMAHEIAHILNGDTVATLYAVIGNGIFTYFILILRAIMWFVEFLEALFTRNPILKIFIMLIRVVFDLIIFAIMWLMQMVMAINSRRNEYRADRFAYELGYGEEMVEALYLLEKINLGENSTVIQKMLRSHPRVTKRIERLELKLELEQV